MSVVYAACGSQQCRCDCHQGKAVHAVPCCHTCAKCGQKNVVFCREELESPLEQENKIEVHDAG